MHQMTLEDQAAIVLNILGDELAETIYEDLTPESVAKIRSRRTLFNEDPPSVDQMDQALDEFERMMRFAMGGALERPPILKTKPGDNDEDDVGSSGSEGDRNDRPGSPSLKLFGQDSSRHRIHRIILPGSLPKSV